MNSGNAPGYVEDLHAAALQHVTGGYYVYPVALSLKPDGRKNVRVLVSSWQEASTTDIDCINEWFGPGRPYAGTGIGIDCEKSGIAVIDLDEGPDVNGHPKTGLANWNALLEQHATAGEPFRVQTRAGGEHMYYRQRPDAPVFNSASSLADDVDTRGVGGCVFAALTRVQGSDQSYRWMTDLPTPVAELPLVPDWVPALLAEADTKEETASVTDGVTPAGNVAKRMEQHCDVIRANPVGSNTGNETVYRRSCYVGQYVGAEQIRYNEARAALISAVDSWQYTDADVYGAIDRGLQWGVGHPRPWDAAAKCGLGAAETNATIQSGLSAGVRKPRPQPEPQVVSEPTAALADGWTWMGASTPMSQPQNDNRLPPASPALLSDQGRSIGLTPASAIPVRAVRWIWRDRLPLGSFTLLAGREGIGKSNIAYTRAADITKGHLDGCFLGTPKSVLVAATEDSWSHTIVPRSWRRGPTSTACTGST
jgi:hypothetical protein